MFAGARQRKEPCRRPSQMKRLNIWAVDRGSGENMARDISALPTFRNEPFLDFSDETVVKGMQAAIKTVRSRFGKIYPLIIGGKRLSSKRLFESRNPNNHAEVIGRFVKATQEQAKLALDTAWRAYEKWSLVAPEKRAELLLRTAEVLRKRRYEIEAVMVLEVGKAWQEADGDYAEAIDLCEYYARQMLAISARDDLVPWPGEKGEYRYIPLGAGAVIPPWNFPAAILLGMAAAAVVCGNTVVLKPSSDAPLTGYLMFTALEEAGMPPGVVNFVTGSGSEVGDFLVSHPKTRFVSFTGSMEVGLRINELAAKRQEGQLWVKRVLLEMGGKNATVVAEDADLESAAKGIVAAAFGYQGQKCSACSRVIIVSKVYEKILPLIKQGAEGLAVAPVEQKGSSMGAVINEAAYRKVMEYIETGKKEGKLIAGGTGDSSTGWMVRPTVFADVAPTARLAQEEIFGPVLTVIRAKDYSDALGIANGTEYGLTGAVYSFDRKKLERARDEFHVGNLYLNRKCTGAICGVHPFGGFNMSGTCSKSGGPDYLLLFLQQKAIAEKTG